MTIFFQSPSFLLELLLQIYIIRKVKARALCAGSREFESQRPVNLTQRCKRFATASTTTQVAVLPCRYIAEMGTANSLHASA